MSDFDFGDSANRADMDNPFNMLRKDLDDIDIPSELDNSLMASDFFDSVFSLGPGSFDDDLNINRNVDLDSDVGISSDADDMRLTNSCSPDSASSSTGYELNDFILVNDNQMGQTVNLVTGEIVRGESPTPIQQKPKIFINKPNARKVIVTKPYITKPTKKFTPSPKQVIRVQSIPGSKKSLLLPFNVTKMKSIKIVNGTSMKAEDVTFTNINDTPVSQKSYLDSYDLTTSPDTFDEDSDSIDARSDHDHQYPMLSLTDEEKRLLSKEGICLPTHYPLTKQEERELKRIRRKIRNKISAQDSRKRKKEYVDGLEESVRQGVEERKILMSRINQLQKLNNRIMVQMGKLQALVCNTSATKATPTASLLIVLLSVLLVTLPNLRTPQDTEWKDQQQVAARRALLSCKAHCEEVQNLEEFLTFNNEDESELQNMLYEDEKIASFAKFGQGGVEHNMKGLAKHFLDNKNNVQGLLNLELDDDIRNTFIKVKKFCNEELDFLKMDEKIPVKRKFIEPDIDEFIDYGPPSKLMKISDTGENYNGNAAFDVVSATVSVNSSEKE